MLYTKKKKKNLFFVFAINYSLFYTVEFYENESDDLLVNYVKKKRLSLYSYR